MDADVVITIAFCLEVSLFALAGGLFVAHEVGKSRWGAAAETRRERLERAAMRTPPGPSPSANVSTAEAVQPLTREGRAIQGLRP